jgi:molybdopterin-containing oxidoreductase family molybdopterin binding subunit
MCFNGCAIRAHRVDGVVVKIEGNPDSPVGEGRVCGKGATGIMQLYDPNRVTKPMKRTNPKKGFAEDPGWQEISWDEAYSIAVAKIGAAVKEDPKSIIATNMVAHNAMFIWTMMLFKMLLGTEWYCSDICGAAIHQEYERLSGTGNCMPDYDYCNYVLQFGCQTGTATRHGFNMTVRRFADARERGCKLVNVDPYMGMGAEKADTWVPIRPGTDAAFALAVAHVLVHELGIYDREFLKNKVNAPDLVDVETGRMVRHKETGKPYVWDLSDSKAKTIDDPTIKDRALFGEFKVFGRKVKPSFELYVEHVKKYTPEYAEKITTVPAAVTRRIAKEFGEAAAIGRTITIEGKEYPLRPAAADCFSGVTRHKHAHHSIWAVLTLNVLVGSMNVPGGLIGFAPACEGHEGTNWPKYIPPVYEKDQFMEAVGMYYPTSPTSVYKHFEAEIKFDPKDKALTALMPLNHQDNHFVPTAQLSPERFKMHAPAKLLFSFASNPLKNFGDNNEMEEFIRSFDYYICCDLFLSDSAQFADLFLPEAQYLERYDVPPNAGFNHHTPGGLHTPWALSLRQPVVPPPDGLPSGMEIILELATRLGLVGHYYGLFNFMFSLGPEYALEATGKYKVEEIIDRIYKSWAGPDKGLEWFKQNGVLTWPRKKEEVYLYPDHPGRIPLYHEWNLEVRERLETELNAVGLPWEQLDEYVPLPEWYPCIDHEIPKPGYELFPVFYTNAVNVDSWGQNNPWINEINDTEPYGYNIVINKKTAESKGLESGDRVTVEASNGRRVTGRIFLAEGVHPEVMGIGGGNWQTRSKNLPLSRGKGSAICSLLEVRDPKRLDHLSSGYDACVRCKVTKAEEAEK